MAINSIPAVCCRAEDLPSKTYTMRFDGSLLARGFWIYVWRIEDQGKVWVYVGRTGDSSSAHASTPFKRIGQHLDPAKNAKGNSLRQRLIERGVAPQRCSFEMIAVGPLFQEEETMARHVPSRNHAAAIERALRDYLDKNHYDVLGGHPKRGEHDRAVCDTICQIVKERLDALGDESRLRTRQQR